MSEIYLHKELAHKTTTKSFTLIIFSFLSLYALLPLFKLEKPHYFFLCLAIGILISGLTYPQIIEPLNKMWFKFGMLLHKIINPIVMGALFFFIFTPLGVILKFMKFDLLSTSLDHRKESYWEKRDNDPTDLKHQF